MSYRQAADGWGPAHHVHVNKPLGLVHTEREWKRIFTGRNEVLAKVIFLQACVCPQGGGGGLVPGGVWSPIFRGGRGVWSPIFRGVSKFSGGVSNRNTVNVRPVRILLECILVFFMFVREWTIRMPITYVQCEQRLSDLQFSDVVQCEQGIAIHSIAFLASQSESTWKRDGQTKCRRPNNK